MISRRELMVGASAAAIAAAIPIEISPSSPGLTFRGVPLVFDAINPPENIFCSQSVFDLIGEEFRRRGNRVLVA